MDVLDLFRLQLILIAIQLIIGVWTRYFPVKKISNPSQKVLVGCCYCSKRSVLNQEAWDYAQKRYSYWCLFLLLPNLVASYVLAKVFLYVVPLISDNSINGLVCIILSFMVPVGFLFECRSLTENDLKKRSEASVDDHKTEETQPPQEKREDDAAL